MNAPLQGIARWILFYVAAAAFSLTAALSFGLTPGQWFLVIGPIVIVALVLARLTMRVFIGLMSELEYLHERWPRVRLVQQGWWAP